MVHVRYSVDITELISAKEVAEESSRSKAVFLAHMSHEIRTPMNAILGVSEIQLFNEQLPAEAKEGFTRIYESGNLLLNIINDILDFSKLDADKMKISALKYEVPSMINDTAQLNLLHNEDKPIDFVLQMDENTPVELIGDELRIKQILNNLLSNAFKYTESGRVKLSVSVAPGQDDETAVLIFEVSDTGQGMNKDQIDRLFDEYSRFNIEANRGISGTGLGMNITKRLIDKMNGEILVESEIGKGSVFTVRLPQKIGGSAVCGADAVNRLQNFSYHNASVSRKTRIVHEYMPHGSVLVVDDIESNLYVARGLLTPYGLNIDTAKSGAEAIDKLKTNGNYDVIFMDHMMPKMDGLQTTNAIRGLGYTLPIIALTANAVSGQAEIFLASGFDGFISKPIDLRELDLVLKEFICDRKPSATVKAARRERSEAVIPKNDLAEWKKYFIMDAEDCLTVLKTICAKTDTLTDEDIKSYIIAAHGIKSALANIGETELSEFAFLLEQAGETRKLDVITDRTPAFINELQSLAERLKPNEANNAVNVSPGEMIYLKEKLYDLQTACESFKIRNAKTVLTDLKQKTWPQEIHDAIDEISVDILSGAFKKVGPLVEKLVNTLG
jgi:CheY-like chemotaxis protein/nitrogen-specific signal transduction histidine kinase